MKNITLLPTDIYQVINKAYLSENDKLILSMLYMPIIGSEAVSLYTTLYNELKSNSFLSGELNHRHLMKLMSINIASIKKSRQMLEGISLLKTYYKEESSINSYVYELYPPLEVSEFFSHPIFNIVLYNNVGKDEYNRLKNYFKTPEINLKNYEEITQSFDYTFSSATYTNLEIENSNIISKDRLKLNYELDFDFDLLITMLPKSFNSKCLNKTVKELIVNLSFLYNIDSITMGDIIKTTLNDKGCIDKEELRKNTRRYYQFNNNNRLPSLIFTKNKDYVISNEIDNSNRARILKVFEDNTPYEFLLNKNKGVKPSYTDMKLLESLMVEYKLNPSVINVLIDYVLKINGNKLSRNYCEKIASQWKRSNVETALEAMNIAEKEHNKLYKEIKSGPSVNTKTPDWFNKNIEKEELSSTEKEELNDLLKEFK